MQNVAFKRASNVTQPGLPQLHCIYSLKVTTTTKKKGKNDNIGSASVTIRSLLRLLLYLIEYHFFLNVGYSIYLGWQLPNDF